jgi:putative exporter of polyketide antibiotics
VAGVALLVLFLVDSLSRVRAGLGGWVSVSPFHLYNLTTVIAPGGTLDGAATIALYVAAVALTALAAVAFARRDLLASLIGGRRGARRAVRTPSANPLLRTPVASALYEQRLGLLAWIVGTALVAAFMASLTASVSDILESTPSLHAYLQASGTTNTRLLVLGEFWFGLGGLLIRVRDHAGRAVGGG